MAAANSDLFRKGGANTVTTLAAPGKALAATSITVGSTTNYPTDTGIVIGIRQVDSDGVLVPGTYSEYNATVTSGTTFSIDAVPVLGSDQVYPAGSTTQVFLPVSSSAHNDLIDGLVESHAQDGTIDAQSVANFRDHIDMTDGKAIRDGNDNEVIKISQTTSAVNELTVKNAATGNAVELQATGGDTDIDLKLKAKGAGVVKLGGLKRQDNTTSSTEGNVLIQYGYGVMPTGVTSLKSESVTFPVAYDSAPIVLVSASGDDTGGATSYTSAGAEECIMFAYSHSVTASGFTIRVRSEGAVNWSSGATVFYSWAAIGPKA